MSVSKMKKLTVFAHKEQLDELMAKLVRLRCVEISSHTDTPEESDGLEALNCDARRMELEASLSDISRAINLLDPLVQKSKGLFAQKMNVDIDSFVKRGHSDRARKTVSLALSAEERLNAIRDTRVKLYADITAATPYVNYDMPLDFCGTDTTDGFLGVLPPATDLDACGKELFKAGAIAQILQTDKNGIYTVFYCHRSDSAEVNALLSSYGFLKASFPGASVSAKELIKQANRDLLQLDAEEKALREKLVELAKSLDAIEVLYDIEATELVTVEQKLKLGATESVAVINGWIPVRREAAVEGFLEKFDCAYDITAPSEDEIPPVLLENNGFASNFEWVLGMYSYPLYGRFDPTFIMSIFYFFIFGIMFADVGYGLLLVLGCFGAVAFLKPGKGLKRALKMFGYCGISCTVFGVLFGSYFGDFPLAFMRNILGMPEDQLPNLSLIPTTEANLAVLMDPLQNPMGFLVLALGVGVVHLVAGMAVKFFILCRDGQVWDAIFDIASYWVLFAGIGLLFVNSTVGMWVSLFAVAVIVLTHGRNEKNLFMKFGKGLLGLYDLVSYASDLLSYSRILALGLSASIIGQVVNILGTMLGPTVAGFIMLVAVFLVGHLLNLAINVLGTFVHTARLQYIEFFGKFYEDGGIPFEPAVPSEKYTEQE